MPAHRAPTWRRLRWSADFRPARADNPHSGASKPNAGQLPRPGRLATHLLEWLPFRPRRFVQGRVKRHTTGRRIAATGHCRAAYEFTCCMRVLKALLIVASLACSACGTTGGALEEPEAILAVEGPSLSQGTPESPKDTEGVEGEVPLAVAESERPETATSGNALEEVVVQAPRGRHELILDLVSVAQSLLRDVELEYFFTGK